MLNVCNEQTFVEGLVAGKSDRLPAVLRALDKDICVTKSIYRGIDCRVIYSEVDLVSRCADESS